MTRRGRAGFTLMELSVTIVVTVAVATIGYHTFASIIDLRARIRGAMAETERAVALRETLRDWLNHGVISIGTSGLPTANGLNLTGQGGLGDDGITVMTTEPTPSLAWGTMIRLFIDNDPATLERGLTMRYLPMNSNTDDFNDRVRLRDVVNALPNPQESKDEMARRLGLQPLVRELDSRIVGLRVEYLDGNTHRWFPARDLTRIQVTAARITLQGAPGTPLPPVLQLPIVVLIPPQLFS